MVGACNVITAGPCLPDADMNVSWMIKAAGEEAGVGEGVLSEAPRQLEDLLSGGLPGLALDAPTIMSLVIIAAFFLQFYWTLITLSFTDASSASSVTPTTTTTTTTAAPSPVVTLQVIRRQTVTPAPPPEWRHLLDFKLPQWVVKRSADVLERSGVKYVHRLDSEASQETPHNAGGVGEVWHARPRMSLGYGSDGGRDAVWRVQEPLPTSSHRLVELSDQDEGVRDTGMAANMLYAAERWGDHLQHWKILSPDGAELLTQTLLMVRCAVISMDFCAKLDHYFRRQHDLNLAAEMMNYHDDSQKYDDDYNYNQWLPELNETWSSENQGPRYVQELQTTTEEDKNGAQQRHSQEQEADRKVWTSGNVGYRTWNIYVFMSVMAVLVFLMDASYRILRVVSTSGRAVNDPHHHLLATLSAAINQWDNQ